MQKKAKRIVIISPQEWAHLFVSKHHYALALTEQGKEVYFINPPGSGYCFSITPHPEITNLWLVTYKIPQWIKWFRFPLHQSLRFIYNLYLALFIIPLFKQMGPVDEWWCFETNVFHSLHPLPSGKKILFLADQNKGKQMKGLVKSAQLVVAVSQPLLDTHARYAAKTLLINHGLSKVFEKEALLNLQHLTETYTKPAKIQVGFAGNLLIGPTIDMKGIMTSISQNPDVLFHFWGPHTPKSGLAVPAETASYIQFLKNAPNCLLHGPVSPEILAKAYRQMDLFMVAINIKLDKNKGSNAHKIMEYLSTGKVVAANYISTYAYTENLIEMADSEGSVPFSDVVKKTITNLEYYNQREFQEKRIKFALNNTYSKQALLIEEAIQKCS